jgi:HAMP domain-containing protein
MSSTLISLLSPRTQTYSGGYQRAILGFEELQESIYALLETFGYEVLLSHKGTIAVDPSLPANLLESELDISRTVSQPIELLKDFSQRIGRGDLNATVKLRSQDEFGLLATTFNQMTQDLRSKTVSKDYVDSILKSMVNTLIVVHPDHTIQSVNVAALQLLDYPEPELIGQSMDRSWTGNAGKPGSSDGHNRIAGEYHYHLLWISNS